MKNNEPVLIIALLVAVVLMVNVSCNRSRELSYSDFDMNDDNVVSQTEFVTGFMENFHDDWDQMQDPYLDDEDFHRLAFEIFDIDQDKKLSDKEWSMATDRYLNNYIVADINEIDVDDDNYVVYGEYYNVVGDTDFFIEWDLDEDSYISEEELARGVFNYWDLNKNNFLEVNEFQEFDMYYPAL